MPSLLPADGHSYERAAAVAWLSHSTSSPLTGEPLSSTVLHTNQALRQLLEEAACC